MVQGASDKEQALDAAQLTAAANLLRTLGTPHRLAIVLELASTPRCVHELVERVCISQSLASQHLRILRNTGLVSGTRRGKETVYALADEHVAHMARDAFTHGAELSHHNRPKSEPTTEEHES